MDHGFQLFPEQASSVAASIDALYFFLLGVAAFFTLLIFFAIVFLALYYRRSAKRNRVRGHSGNVWILEIVWIAIPFALTMVMFAWGADLYFDIEIPPPDALEIQVVGKQWMWKTQHPQGRREINELHIPTDKPIRLRMISEDVIHSFYVPAFRVKQDVLPGRYSSLWFEATRPGKYHLFCAEYCGTDHANMSGHVYAMKPADYAEWLAGGEDQPPTTAGEELFTRFRCHTCHFQGPDARCPMLENLFGSTVQLTDGRTVAADEQFLRESIMDPGAKVVAGFQPLMPTYQGQLTEEQVFQLVEYIKSLKVVSNAAQRPAATKPSPPASDEQAPQQ
jgi:cytochrome c oxidase subunit 2